jgi:transposase
MGETARKQYRRFTAQQRTELVLASLRGQKTFAEICRENDIADSLLRKWRDQFLAVGAERLSGTQERTELAELRGKVAKLERALGRNTMELEISGELLPGWE